MIRSIVLDLAVAITPSQGAAAPLLAVDDALAAADLAAASGVDALRIVDLIAGGAALEGSVAAAYLAGAEPDIGFLVDAPTSHNAPYNLARRLLSIDRATGGRSGLVLRPGRGDAVSELTAPDPAARDVRERWAEYAGIVTRLWESFPAAALLGDQESGIFAEESLISPIDHLGRYYRVAGPLDGPSSRQGRPVLAVADAELLGWDVVAAAANIVLVDAGQAATADARLTEALEAASRRREEVRLLGRALVADGDGQAKAAGDLDGQLLVRGGTASVIEQLQHWADSSGLDGLDLTVPGGLAGVTAVLREVVTPLKGPAKRAGNRTTLREALGLPALAGRR